MKFKEYGIDLEDGVAAELLPRVRASAVSLKRSLFDKELVYIYEDWKKEKAM